MGVKDLFRQHHYNTKTPVNPMERAKKATYEHEGDLVIQRRNWQRCCLCLMFCLVVAIVGIVVQSFKPKAIPYVVEIDKASGEVVSLGAAQEQKYLPTEAVKKYFIGEFIRNLREVPLDPVVNVQNKEKAYAYITKQLAARLDSSMSSDEINKNIGRKTRQVKIVNILPMSNDSYQCRWTEEEFDIQSGNKKVIPMSAVITIEQGTPAEKTINVNPLGIYFRDFSYSQDTVK